MANILLTTRCNLNCSYCFAQERLQGDRRQVMSMSDVSKVIDFLKRSEHLVFRAMGGEPTLHPNFPEIVELALAEDMRVDVLSNATWPESCNHLFERISPRRLFFLLNIDNPDNYPAGLWSRIEHNLDAIAPRGDLTLSFNLFQVEPESDYIFDLLTRYKIDKVRMSFSLPVVGANNTYLKLEDYEVVAPFILEFVRRAEAMGVVVRFDNAVPLCIFTFEQAGELLMKGVLNFQHNARCDPIIDIGPDLTVWCCFCLSKLWNRHLDEFENLQQAVAFYQQAISRYQGRLFPMDKCYECRYRELWGCQGGCLTFTIWRYGELPAEGASAPAECAGPDADALLALADEVEIQQYDIPRLTYTVLNKATGLEMEVDGSFERLLGLLDGRYSAEQVVDRFVVGDDGSDADGLLAAFAERATKATTHDLLLRMQHAGFITQRASEAGGLMERNRSFPRELAEVG